MEPLKEKPNALSQMSSSCDLFGVAMAAGFLCESWVLEYCDKSITFGDLSRSSRTAVRGEMLSGSREGVSFLPCTLGSFLLFASVSCTRASAKKLGA